MRGHMIMPTFFVGKATRKEVSAADWAAMSAEGRIKHLRFVANLKRLNRIAERAGTLATKTMGSASWDPSAAGRHV